MGVKQGIIIGTLVLFFILLVIIEKKSSIKIILRIVLTIASLCIIYKIGIVNNINVAILTIFLVFIISFINVFIKDGVHKKAFSEWFSVMILTLLIGISIFVICKLSGVELLYQDIEIIIGIEGFEFSIAVMTILGVYLDIVSRIISKLDNEKDRTEDTNWKKEFKNGMTIGKELINEKISILILFSVRSNNTIYLYIYFKWI